MSATKVVTVVQPILWLLVIDTLINLF